MSLPTITDLVADVPRLPAYAPFERILSARIPIFERSALCCAYEPRWAVPGKGQSMHSSHRHITWLLMLSLAVAAIALPPAQASSRSDEKARTWELHWQHENALYERKEAAARARAHANRIARHFRHEDAVHRTREAGATRPGSAEPLLTAPADGFRWSYVLGGAGAAFALIILGTTATIGIRRRSSHLAGS